MKTYKTERQKLVEQYQNLQTNDELLAAQALYYKQKKEKEEKLETEQWNNDEIKIDEETSNNKKESQYEESTLLIGNILEKNTLNLKIKNISSFTVTEKGFPSVFKHNQHEIQQNVQFHENDSMWHHQQFFNINNNNKSPPKKQKLSLFAQRIQSLNHQQINYNQQENDNNNDDKNKSPYSMLNMMASFKMANTTNSNDKDEQNKDENVSFISKLNAEANIVNNDEINKIGSENDNFLKQHNESEIIEMRQELLSSLDPNLIALLTGNKETKHSSNDAPKKSMKTLSKKQKRSKIKVSYDNDDDDESKDEYKEDIKPKHKSAVIRKLKPLRSKHINSSKDKTAINSKPQRIKSNKTEWIHPAKEVSSTFDVSLDINNDAPGPTQKEKMEWMEPVNVKDEENKYNKTDTMALMLGDNPLEYYRFGFDGKALCDNKGIIKQTDKNDIKIDDNNNNNNDKADDFYQGLHHHGDEPLKPGYTINELMHLCKSTVPNQRNTAIKTFMYIIQRMRAGQYGMDYSEYLWILLQQKNLLRLIIDILSIEKNVSCIIPILDLLHAIIVPIRILFDTMTNNNNNIHDNDDKNDIYTQCGTEMFYNAQTERLIFDGYHILCNTLPNITPIEMDTNQHLFNKYKEGGNQRNKGSLNKNEMNDIWKCDVILALLRKTKIIGYFNNILSKYVLSNNEENNIYIWNILPSILDIIMCFVKHHPEIIETMIKSTDFMDNLLQIVFCGNNKDKNYSIYKCKVMDIICIMCQMNKRMIEYLMINRKLDDFKQFIHEGLNKPNNSEKLQLSISTLQIWRVCIKYGYDFNELSAIWMNKFVEIFRDFTIRLDDKYRLNVKREIIELQQRQTRGLLNIINILIENLTPLNISKLPTPTMITWNQMATLVENVINIFDKIFNNEYALDINKITETDWLCIGGLCHIMSAHFKTLMEQTDDSLGQSYNDFFKMIQRKVLILTKKYIATWSIPKENKLLSLLLLNKRNWTYNNTESGDEENKLLIEFPFLDGLLCDIPLSIAVIPNNEYLSKCDCLLGIIKMVQSFIKINSKIISILIQSRFIDGIGRILLQITSKHFHFRLNRSLRGLLFNYWRIEWLLAFEILSLCNLCKSDLSQIKTLNITNIHSAACVLLECLPPGYQHFGDILLIKYILSRNYLPKLKKLTIKYLRNINDKNLLNGKLTTFYIESDINSFHKQLIDIYTKYDKYLPNVFNKNIRNLCNKKHSFSNVSRIQSLYCIPTMIPTFWMLQPMINLYKHQIPNQSITALLHFYFIISRSYNDDFMDEIITFDDDDDDDDDNNIKSHHYWCNIAVWDTYRSIGTLYLCDSNIYCDELNAQLIYKLIDQCWNRIYYTEYNKNNNNNNIYLCDKTDPSSSCIIDAAINEINIGLQEQHYNIKSLGREWEGFYTKLVEQFESDSFGDDLFAKIILFQQNLKYNKRFRTIIWSSIDSLCILLKNQYPPNIYLWKSYFIPFENDKIIIHFQFQSIIKNKFNNLSNFKNSFLYFIAIIQISHYIWNKNKKYDLNMLNNLFSECDKSVIIDVINCNFNHLNSLIIDNNYDPLQCLKQLKEFINLGKDKIIINENNKYRISMLKNDFNSVCKKLSLF